MSVWTGGAAERRGALAGAGSQVPAQRRRPGRRESQPLHHINTSLAYAYSN